LETSGVVLARVSDLVERRAAGRAAALLTSRERERWGRIHHQGRRDEFLAARVLVKYLWSAPSPAAPPPGSAVRWVAREEVQGFLDAALGRPPVLRRARMLQLLPGPGGEPELRWRGRPAGPLSVSLTHSGGWVAVAVSAGGRVGVDLERIEGRSPAFATVFTPAERAWSAARAGVSLEASQTLLWALREAAFKAGLTHEGGDEPPFEIVPDAAAPTPFRWVGPGPWPLQALPVALSRGRAGIAEVLLDDGFVLARLAAAPRVPDPLLPPS
jgi:phosphopantetheinyl transferase